MDDADAPREMPSNVREPLAHWRILPRGPRVTVTTLRSVPSKTAPGWKIIEVPLALCRVPLEQRAWDRVHAAECRACRHRIYVEARSRNPVLQAKMLAQLREQAEQRAARSLRAIEEARARRACDCQPLTAPIDISELVTLFEARRHLSMLLAARARLDERIAEARDELARLQADESGA